MSIMEMSNLMKPTELFKTKQSELLIDIGIVAAVSGLAFFLEGIAVARGWMPYATELRGVSAVIAGTFAALGVVQMRGGTLADLGFRRPERWAIVPFQVVGILAAFIVVQSLVPLIVSTFMTLPAPDVSRYDSIAGNLGAALIMVVGLPLTASIPEEIIYRGFLIGRLSGIFGTTIGGFRHGGAVLTVLVQALIFGAIHYQWGVGGIIMTFIMGIVWGTAYLWCGRNLWIVILAHSAGHILFVIQLYLATSIIV